MLDFNATSRCFVVAVQQIGPAMAVLIILSGKQSGRKIRLPQRDLTIGRDEGCFLRVASVDVSRQHSQLCPSPKGWLIRDLKSQNGTWLNGAKVTQDTLLQCGDELVVGHMKFQWEGPRPEHASQSVLEDSIAEWLTEQDTSLPQGHAPGDTTILEGRSATPHATSAPASGKESPAAPAATPAPTLASSNGQTNPLPIRPAPDRKQTLAEEAKSVIQFFVEQVGDSKPPALADE